MIDKIEEHLQNYDYDVKKSGNARFMDQKVTPDVLYIVANCILEYVQEKEIPKIKFNTKDIWESKYANEEVQNIFNKPDVMSARAKSEYDKFFAQPLKMLEYSKILTLTKKGNRNIFNINNLEILEYIAIRERNSLLFLTKYLEKVLRDSQLWELFDTFYTTSTRTNFDNLKDGFRDFLYKYTRINKTNKYEPGRIFTKIINPLAYSKKSLGTKGGFLSKDIIGFGELMYNRKNWRDITKLKGETRQDYETRAKNLIQKRKSAYSKFSIQQAKKLIKKRYDKVSEVQDELAVGDATQVHHIFPKNEFPNIETFVENLILLTATQHSTKAHPNNNTRRIDKAYQYICLLSKCSTIEQSVEVLKDGFYSKEDFTFVLNTGIETDEYYEDLTFEDIRTNLTRFYHN
ncbi:hypothetical protein J2Q11_11595 [Tenacibaculum finnmarkense genomovar finnmarkense]|uniref:hypothetical protein n=1 Tax=Tenacibaculum finnmarkense TaxID=2781243 RepID=UPI001EFBA4D1|nr:hypothetical protein [Tenacibaculum finnmarkense]MCG8213459.1 hypothetical protein [Tenacibaculum finnmarkense genomovar finnmarkense]MCG8231772.1 hypothetical protein [Tenacibaculum finnmarkense genomovar finnmarkense]MCG8242114.1 hypothetical protein [Tenacibaculum finnmarkense genomovar finnmarkense]MCG8718902.1 restriction endonuclease [Tenacibaculum finnmarkense]MCG8726645.1 restriction endonuclease [Tenacibaculum finnmarkense]